VLDGQRLPRPYVAEAVPELDTDRWLVFPDGRMETIYRLRPGVVWHDGAPLTANDFLFAWRVYSVPDFGGTGFPPLNQLADISALDPSTVVFHWRRPYPDAAALGDTFQPLPRHILEAAYEAGPDSLANHSYWSTDYVGLGPYRLARWEPGAVIEGTAFERHVLGRPRIDRVIARFISDENTVLTNVLAGIAELTATNTLRFEHAAVLRNEWASNQQGIVRLSPEQPRFIHIQFRPELLSPPAIRDRRVRAALAHAIDKAGLNEGLFNGEGSPADTFISRHASYFAELDRTITKYPYDVRRTEQLMKEAGYERDAQGLFVGGGERFNPELWVQGGAQNEKEGAIVADGWRQAGADVRTNVLSPALLSDGQARSSFPAFYSTAGAIGERAVLSLLVTSAIPGAANRWQGSNRGGWSNPELEALWDAYNTTLKRSERDLQVVDMMRIVSEELPYFMLFHNFTVVTHRATLRGLDPQAPGELVFWNAHEWTLSES
jgi:peptide/nickel transport system substrate-binding protein